VKSVGQEISELIYRGLDSHLKIAVTGLSRAGKTAFITSLINQIQSLSTHHQLPFLSACREHRIVGTKRMPQKNLLVSRFDYEQAIGRLQAEDPVWPEPTRDVSETRVAIKYRPVKRSKRLRGKSLTLTLDIVDYPGEWLLDLPLLTMSFEQWSRQQMQMIKGIRRDLSQDWFCTVQHLDLNSEADEQRLAEIAADYTDYLQACKAQGLHWVQPGRFVLPGELAGAPVLQFFPCAKPKVRPKKRRLITNYDLLQTRFEEYKTKVVQAFYRNYFSTFDRQVVLVDCLTPLNQGYESFMDMQYALMQILQSFKYGRSGLFSRLFAPKIDKVLFAATKTDHITPEQHAHLVQLLNQMVYPAWQHAAYEDVAMQCMSLASIQATQSGYIQDADGRHAAIQGQALDGTSVTLFPGEVPGKLPDAGYWQSHQFDFVAFSPLKAEVGEPLPQIRLDRALEYLIGDKLL
jgi:predicted YcjX-like family ATPase